MPTVLVTAEEAANYLGVSLDELPSIIAEHDISDVDGDYRETDIEGILDKKRTGLRDGFPGLIEELLEQGDDLSVRAAQTIELLSSDAVEAMNQNAQTVRCDYNGITGGEIVTASPIWGVLASMAQAEFDRYPDAENFLATPIEMTLSPAHPRKGFTIIIQRQEGKSPGEIIAELKARIAELEGQES